MLQIQTGIEENLYEHEFDQLKQHSLSVFLLTFVILFLIVTGNTCLLQALVVIIDDMYGSCSIANVRALGFNPQSEKLAHSGRVG